MTLSLCEDKSAVVLLSSPARSQQEVPPSCSPISSSSQPLTFRSGPLQSALWDVKGRTACLVEADRGPGTLWGLSALWQPPGKTCEGLPIRFLAACAEKGRGSSCSVWGAKFHRCQNSSEHNRHTLRHWGRKAGKTLKRHYAKKLVFSLIRCFWSFSAYFSHTQPLLIWNDCSNRRALSQPKSAM